MNEMLRNGSGYIDNTAFQGMTRACPGEIWTKSDNEEDYRLILAVKGTVMSVLKLVTRDAHDHIPVICHETMFVNPLMANYMFNTSLGHYVKSLPKAEFAAIQKAVGDAMGVTGTTDDKDMKKQLEDTQVDLRIQKDTNKMLSDSITQLEVELAAYKPYRDMYDILLDKLIAKVGAAL